MATIRSDDAMTAKMMLKRCVVVIPYHLFWQMQANPSGVEFLRKISKFRKRNKILLCLPAFSIKCKIRHYFTFSVMQKCREFISKKCDIDAKLLFCLLNLFFQLSLLLSRCQILKSLITMWNCNLNTKYCTCCLASRDVIFSPVMSALWRTLSGTGVNLII